MDLFLLGNIFLLFTGLLGFIVILIILTSIKSNKLANIYLVIFLAIANIRFILIGIFQINSDNILFEAPSAYKTLFLFSIPCYYLYFKALVNSKTQFNKKNILHFGLPTLIFLWNLLAVHFLSFGSPVIVKINYFLASGLVFYYTIVSILFLQKNLWRKIHAHRFPNYHLIRNWTIFLFVVCTLLSIRLLTSLTYEVFYEKSLSGGKFSYILAAFIWLLILIKLLISPEILHGLPKLKKRIQSKELENVKHHAIWNLKKIQIKNEQDQKLQEKIEDKLMELIQQIEDFVQKERIFRNPKTTIQDLAAIMGVPTSYLVYLFKYHSDLTFVEYKTLQRIEDSIEFIQKEYLKSNTLESLAGEVGFSSYNPFFSAFKKHTGLSPNDYVSKNGF